MMLRDSRKPVHQAGHGDNDDDGDDDDDDMLPEDSYFTYRPLSNLPTPPPSSRDSSEAQPSQTALDDGEPLQPKFRGPAIHLVNLIPSSASLAAASIPIVQAILGRANLPLETVALAVCILDSLDAKFARTWRLSCPLRNSFTTTITATSKRHTLPPTPLVHDQQLHIDSVSPELIVLSALVIAAKFTEDPQQPTSFYGSCWGRSLWSAEQLNVTERCIVESLGYRILPLCDEDVLADAMVDMQLAARQHDWHHRQPSPPESVAATSGAGDGGGGEFVPSHSRSKTVATFSGMGLPRATIDVRSARTEVSTPRPA